MKNKLKNIVIVAGGENTRFNEMSIFPKVLLPTLEYPSILAYDCKLFSGYDIYLIINDRYLKMTKQYVNKTNLNVKVIGTNNHNGSANTIKSVIDLLPKENVLFVWSDLLLDDKGIQCIKESIENRSAIFNTFQDTNSIIFTYNGQYRYKCDSNKIEETKNYDGNAPGIYYCNDLKEVISYDLKDNYDLIDIFKNDDKSWCIADYKGLITEFRDLDTYCEYYKNDDLKTKTRFFNTMKISDGKLIKKCINPQYYKLIDRECNWYENCIENEYKHIPKIYDLNKDEHSMTMEYLDGYLNVYEYIKKASDEDFNEFMQIYLNAVRELHELSTKIVDTQDVCDDFEQEFYTKVVNRCNNISGILYDYDEDALKELLVSALDKIYELSGDVIKDSKNSIYCFTHGDLNGSNVMYNPQTKDIKFIDPRGYFGFSMLYGPASYDFAKILYCLTGYDDFNNGRFIFTKDWYTVPKVLRNYDFGKNHTLYGLMVGIIWIALAEYISQDVFKANIAYQHGKMILEELL